MGNCILTGIYDYRIGLYRSRYHSDGIGLALLEGAGQGDFVYGTRHYRVLTGVVHADVAGDVDAVGVEDNLIGAVDIYRE